MNERRACWMLGALLCLGASCDDSGGPEQTANNAVSCLDAADGDGTLGERIAARAKRLKTGGGDTAAWVDLGKLWVLEARREHEPRHYLRAEACAACALEREPGHHGALNLRGLALLNRHDFRGARALAQRILAEDPDDPMAWGLMSDARLELGNTDGAVEAAQRMVDLEPSLPSYTRAAHLRWLEGNVTGAKHLYQEAIGIGQLSPDSEALAWVLVEAAMVFWHEGDYAGADAGFDEALRHLPGYPPALVGKGRAALARREFGRAARWLADAHERAPSAQTAWLLGDALSLAGQRAAAREAYQDVVRLGRHDGRTLALFYATKHRDLDGAVRLARREYETRRDAYTRDALAWALFRAGRIDEARALSPTARELRIPDARLLYRTGTIRRAAGEADGARLVERALTLNPGFDPALTQAAGLAARNVKGTRDG